MPDIPASCYTRHLSPPDPVEYEIAGQVVLVLVPRYQSVFSLNVTIKLPYTVSYERATPYEDLLDEREIIADMQELINAHVKQHLPTRDPADIIDRIVISKITETM